MRFQLLNANYYSSRNSSVFTLLKRPPNYDLPDVVLLPNFRNQSVMESVTVEFKSYRNTVKIFSQSEWQLSLHSNSHFVVQESSIIILCFLQFSIENASRFVGSEGDCNVFVRWSNNPAISDSGSCVITVGRSPVICIATVNLSRQDMLHDTTALWASIDGEILFRDISDVRIMSTNSVPIVLNEMEPLNWTTVQSDTNFGQLQIGLPMTSVRAKTSFEMPVVVTDDRKMKAIKIMVEYDKRLYLNGLKISDGNRWDGKMNFKRDENREYGSVRFSKLSDPTNSRSIHARTELTLFKFNFTVMEERIEKECWFRIGIATYELDSGSKKVIFTRNNFNRTQPNVTIATDFDRAMMITIAEPVDAAVQLYSNAFAYNNNNDDGVVDDSKSCRLSRKITAYLLYKSGEKILPDFSKTVYCSCDNKTGRPVCTEFNPQLFHGFWVLPIHLQPLKRVVYNLFNTWHPDSWSIELSDNELNPISSWKVPEGFGRQKCIVMYQSSIMKIGLRLKYMNSLGLMVDLGSTIENPETMVDVTKLFSLNQLKVYPPDVVLLSRNKDGYFIVHANQSSSANISLYSKKKELLARSEIFVSNNHWASVSNVTGRCLKSLNLKDSSSHPGADGSFKNMHLELKKNNEGDRCKLLLRINYNDGSVQLLDNINPQNYELVVNGAKLMYRDTISYSPKINISLRKSVKCEELDKTSVIYEGTLDLQNDGLLVSTKAPDVSEHIVNIHKIKETTPINLLLDQPNSLMIGVYTIIGVIAIVVFVLTLNFIIGYFVRKQSITGIRHRLSKRNNSDLPFTKSPKEINCTPESAVPSSPVQYPPLLPPPGPILIGPAKPKMDWAVSSESGLGHDRSSQGSNNDPVCLSTFHSPYANGSTHPSDSLSYVRQTSPVSDPVLDVNSAIHQYSLISHFPESKQPLSRAAWNSFRQTQSLATDHSTSESGFV